MARKFTEEFRAEAVRLVKDQGLTAAQVAKDLGVGLSTLSRWLAAAATPSGSEMLSESEKEELKRLREENHTLRMGRDPLKKRRRSFQGIQFEI